MPTDTATVTTTTGYGQTRKTRNSAQREANLWNASGSGAPYESAGRTNVTPPIPAHRVTVTASCVPVEGGYACAYTTEQVWPAGVTPQPGR